MIKSFKCKESKKIWHMEISHKLPKSIQQKAFEKLKMLSHSSSLKDLSIPPSNRLEKLQGERAETYSIRVNAQWRICFKWINNDAYDVEIVDYH